MKTRRLAALALLMSLLGGSAQAAPADDAQPGTSVLRLASAEPTTLDPAFDLSWTGVPRLVFSFLTTIGPDGTRTPDVAMAVPTVKNGGISEDGRTVTFHLRHNVRWQDGAPLTAADCAFTFATLSNPATGTPSTYELSNIASVTARGPYTVVLHLKRKGALSAQGFLSEDTFPILPEHVLANVKPSDLKRADFSQHPIGSGPYRVVEWVHGDHLTLAANPAYFNGKPKIDTIRLTFVEDADTIVNELRAGEIDGALILDRSVYDHTRDLSGMRSVLTPEPGMGLLLMNDRSGPTADLRVRKAIAAAVDTAYIAEVTWPGQPKTGNAREFVLGLPYTASASPPFDLAAAKALLDEAGWHVGPDGLRYRDGEQLALDLATLAGQPSTRIDAVTIQAELRAVGIVVTVREDQVGRFVSPDGPLMSGHFGLGILSPTLDSHDTGSFYRCGSIPPNGYNIDRLCDPRVDAAEAAQASAADEAEQRRANAKLETFLEQDVPDVTLWQQEYLSVSTDRLHGLQPTPITPYFHAWNWSLDPPAGR